MDSFPTFCVIGNRSDERGIMLLGSVSSTQYGHETWVSDRYLGYLKHGDFLIYGRWHLGPEHWEFVVEQSEHLHGLREIKEFEVLDGYWGERAELVLNRRITWDPTQWNVQEDHDHCAICWATISASTNQEHFVATSGERVCASCYRTYVSMRALTFIPMATQQIVGPERG